MNQQEAAKAQFVRTTFARIVPRYDLVNWLMTLGLDRRWRKATVELVRPQSAVTLDLATGTADLAIELARQGSRTVVGLDFCPEMLEAGRAKVAARGLEQVISLAAGDALALPFDADTFDAAVNAFALRNVANLPRTFAELCRVLRPGGRLGCLDLTPPRGPLKGFFGLYINRMVPLLGAVAGGDLPAYRYLAESLRAHPEADRLKRMLDEAGFVQTGYRLVGFGTVAIHYGVKPARPSRAESRGAPASPQKPSSKRFKRCQQRSCGERLTEGSDDGAKKPSTEEAEQPQKTYRVARRGPRRRPGRPPVLAPAR